jgi:hypothetical protein
VSQDKRCNGRRANNQINSPTQSNLPPLKKQKEIQNKQRGKRDKIFHKNTLNTTPTKKNVIRITQRKKTTSSSFLQKNKIQFKKKKKRSKRVIDFYASLSSSHKKA